MFKCQEVQMFHTICCNRAIKESQYKTYIYLVLWKWFLVAAIIHLTFLYKKSFINIGESKKLDQNLNKQFENKKTNLLYMFSFLNKNLFNKLNKKNSLYTMYISILSSFSHHIIIIALGPTTLINFPTSKPQSWNLNSD